MKDLIIYGAGDVGKFIAYNLDLFDGEYNLLGFIDDDKGKTGGEICGLPVFGSDYLQANDTRGLSVAIAINSPAAKEAVVKKLEPYKLAFPNFIARNSWLSNGVTLGNGIIIYPNCSINYETEIGNFATINAGCAIGHNAGIGDYSSLAPVVGLGGFTRIGRGANLGIGCCTKQGVEIGAGCVIGGQAMVIENIPAGRTAVGVPAKVIK